MITQSQSKSKSQFQPKQRTARQRFKKAGANIVAPVASPVIGGVGLGVTGVIGGAALGIGVPKHRITKAVATPVLGVLGGAYGAVGGAITGVLTGIKQPVQGAIKGTMNIFGRKTPDRTLIVKAMADALPFMQAAQMTSLLKKVKKDKILSSDEKKVLAIRLKDDNLIENVAKRLGANDQNMPQAVNFIKENLGVDGIYDDVKTTAEIQEDLKSRWNDLARRRQDLDSRMA